MFLILGTSPVRKIGNSVLRCHCPRCSDIRNFQEVSIRQYLSFFFIPIFPIAKANTIYVCPTCKFGMTAADAIASSRNELPEGTGAGRAAVPSGTRTVVFCPRCDGPMYLPTSERRQEVTCPHCTMEFTVKGVKGLVPEAVLRGNGAD